MEQNINQPIANDRKSSVQVAGVGIITFLWMAALEVVIRWNYIGLFVIGLMTLIIVAYSIWRRHHTIKLLDEYAAIGLVLVSSVGVISFMDGNWVQHLAVLISGLLLWLVMNKRRQQMNEHLRSRLMAFVMSVVMFFCWWSVLSAGIYLVLPWWWVMVTTALVNALVAMVIWRDAAFHWRTIGGGMVMMAWLGAELGLVIWWLPTAIMVGSVIATITNAIIIQAIYHLWKNDWEVGRGRRYLVIGTSICAIVLLSARWI